MIAVAEEVTPKPSPRWQGLRPANETLPDGTIMPSENPIIVNCTHDTPGLCVPCLEDFRLVLADVPLLLDDLDVAIAGWPRFVEHGDWLLAGEPAGDGAHPAVKAHQWLSRALTMYAGDWYDARRPEQVAEQLLATLDLVADEPILKTIARQITRDAARARRAIDRPEDWVYYGSCPECGRDIYNARISEDDDQARVKCFCGYSERLREHQIAMLDAGDDRMLTVDELVGAITKVGELVTRKQIRRFVDHEGVVRDERVIPRLVDQKIEYETVETYRLGDIRALANGEDPALIGTITSREVAALLGMSEEAVRKLVERDKLAPVRSGAKPLRFKLDEVDRYKATRKQ